MARARLALLIGVALVLAGVAFWPLVRGQSKLPETVGTHPLEQQPDGGKAPLSLTGTLEYTVRARATHA